jgi:hypothetical protein|tara:strand:+ start:1174 stop:1491 length:318 start_codon:yes stop_codon:yes gene_type:complete
MAKLAELLEENVKDNLNYEEKTWQIPHKLFRNLIGLCIAYKIPVIQKEGKTQKVLIELTKGDKSLGSFYAKPFVKNDRLMLSFKQPYKILLDASYAFGEQVQIID